jgi:hypothetical protein
MGCVGFREMGVEVILWVDSNALFAWQPKEEYDAEESMLCRSAGFVSQENDESVTLVLSESPRSFNSCITIPKCAIVFRRKLVDGGKLICLLDNKGK